MQFNIQLHHSAVRTNPKIIDSTGRAKYLQLYIQKLCWCSLWDNSVCKLSSKCNLNMYESTAVISPYIIHFSILFRSRGKMIPAELEKAILEAIKEVCLWVRPMKRQFLYFCYVENMIKVVSRRRKDVMIFIW